MHKKWKRESYVLPGKYPHVDDALMNHLILKGIWCGRCLIVCLETEKKDNIQLNRL